MTPVRMAGNVIGYLYWIGKAVKDPVQIEPFLTIRNFDSNIWNNLLQQIRLAFPK